MSSAKIVCTQSTANATTSVMIPTGLTVDGKAGWGVVGMQVDWDNPSVYQPIAPTTKIDVQLNTESGVQGFLDPDLICSAGWRIVGVVGSTTAVDIDYQKTIVLPVNRLTVQPNLYVTVSSTALTAAGTFNVTVFYDIVKLTDLETMRLMQGGA